MLAKNGGKVVLCSRSVKNGEDAIAKIKESDPEADITTMQLDLGSFKSIYAFAAAYTATKKPLNLLINNAGIMAAPKALTEDGFESQFGVNHLGHFLLTTQLLPLLIASGTKENPSRVINLSSGANIMFSSKDGIKMDDLNGDKTYYKWERYGESKLANILFTKELNRRMQAAGQPVISVAVHPGVILATNLMKDYSLSSTYQFIGTVYNKPGVFSEGISERRKSIPEGAATTVLTALHPDVVPGAYYVDCKPSEHYHQQAKDAAFATHFWKVSEDLVASKK